MPRVHRPSRALRAGVAAASFVLLGGWSAPVLAEEARTAEMEAVPQPAAAPSQQAHGGEAPGSDRHSQPEPTGEIAGDEPAETESEEATAIDTSAPPTTTLASDAPRDAHEKISTNQPSILSAVVATKKERWEQANGGFSASRLAIARRLAGRPDRLFVQRSEFPAGQDAFLWKVARDTWAGIEAYTDSTNGLIVDNVRVIGGAIPPVALRVGDYTSITNIGLHLVAIAAARAIGLVEDTDARATATRILDTLADLERHNGYFFNYYDTTTLEPTSSFLSFVDSAWLVAGLIVTRQAFPDLARTATDLAEPIDFRFFYDNGSKLMSHGYYTNFGTLSAFEYGAFYTEARLGSVIAIGKGDAPPAHWYAMRRALRRKCEGRECPEMHHLRYENAEGRPMAVAHYLWRGTEYVPSWGGSMFEALMPRVVLDEDRWAPRSLGQNGRAHAYLQKTYAAEVLGIPVWGMSPSMSPITGRYGEFGVKLLGNHGYDESVVTPHATALALAVAPDDAAEGLMQVAHRYDIYGPFGFYDAVAPQSGRVAYDQLALDQLMLFLSVANHLSRGEVPNLFASDPWVRPALALLAEERFFE